MTQTQCEREKPAGMIEERVIKSTKDTAKKTLYPRLLNREQRQQQLVLMLIHSKYTDITMSIVLILIRFVFKKLDPTPDLKPQ